ncbi:FadR/GntR family transcriptional regulator [Micropruina sonneratiae]|uniref:FadR/GntR family transcriptional regulator n=1 Tax=Micropruina sonneratiae TaxID=2986940 RepID=UPI002225C7DA|nr:FadR/GntR family transcriptional regulator [Micropruina sp. KQZ13P-5]MCW3156969.1 FadR family transcriptional regulator [Micropruina sp. KQZ13P-5]
MAATPDTAGAALNGSVRGHLSVADLIKSYILDKHLKPGDPMPTEAELSQLLGISRSSVREAVKTLSSLDIVEVRHGHGTFVGRMSLTAMVQSLAFRGLLSPKDDQHVLSDLVDLRELLESSLASAFIHNLQRPAVLTLRRLAATMSEKAARSEEFTAEDRDFHMVLMEASGNALAVQLTGAFWDVHSIALNQLGAPSDLVQTAEAHAAIIDAIEFGDEQAVKKAIVDHYSPVRRRMARAVGDD